jgi:N-acetylglutamate synthase-like GNAT family acetyltransferase
MRLCVAFGTVPVGLKDIGSGQTALRKMFVAAPFRRRELGVAGKLFDVLLAHARGKGVAEIFLGTTDKFLAAHRFFTRAAMMASCR